MTAQRYAIVRTATGKVENVHMLDPQATWSPPPGCESIQSDTVRIGDVWNGTSFAAGPAADPDPLDAERAKVRAFKNSPAVQALIAADPATLSAAEKLARGQAIAFLALIKILRAEGE